MAAEAPDQGVEMSYRTGKAGGPLYPIGYADGHTHTKKAKTLVALESP